MKYFRCCILAVIAIFLSGCYEEIPTEEIQGYWKSKPHFSSPVFEFYNGATAVSADMRLRTGRIEKENGVAELFYWEKDVYGNMLLSVVAEDCPTRPLTTCPLIADVEIKSAPISKNKYLWDISYDYKDENLEDGYYQALYKKNGLRLRKISNGEVYFNPAENPAFSNPYFSEKTNSTLTVRLEALGSVTDLTASLSRKNRQANVLNFEIGQELENTVVTQFSDVNGGTVNLNVTSSLSSATMVASEKRVLSDGSSPKGNYVLSWVINKNIDFPDGVSPDSIDTSGFISEERFSQVVELFDNFIAGPQVAAGDLYFTHFPGGFLTADSFANELNFSGVSDGLALFVNAIDENLKEEKVFEWSQQSNGQIDLLINDISTPTTIRFLTEIDGGYRVLYSVPDELLGARYFIRDFITPADIVLSGADLPGVYKVVNVSTKPNGSSLFDVIFNADGTVEGDLLGFWFENADGSIQSYECFDLQGALIEGYFECLSAIQNNTYSFAWVRKVAFIHQNGNEYKSKYNSVIFMAGVPFPLNFAWTYRFIRISD